MGTTMTAKRKPRLPVAEVPARRWVSREQAAEYYNVSSLTVDAWCATGAVTRYRTPTGSIKLDLLEIERWFEEHAERAQA